MGTDRNIYLRAFWQQALSETALVIPPVEQTSNPISKWLVIP